MQTDLLPTTTARFLIPDLVPAAAPAVPAPAPPAPATPAPVLPGKVSFGTIKKKTSEAKAAKTYPLYPADPTTQDVVAWLIENLPTVDQVDTAKKNLIEAVTGWYMKNSSGKAVVESSVEVPSPKGSLLIVFPKQLVGSATAEDLAPYVKEHMGAFFRSKFEIKVDGDKVPAAAAQDLINELIALFGRYGAEEALTCKENVVPTDAFHALRHTTFDADTNLAINCVTRIKTMVKIKAKT